MSENPWRRPETTKGRTYIECIHWVLTQNVIKRWKVFQNIKSFNFMLSTECCIANSGTCEIFLSMREWMYVVHLLWCITQAVVVALFWAPLQILAAMRGKNDVFLVDGIHYLQSESELHYCQGISSTPSCDYRWKQIVETTWNNFLWYTSRVELITMF